MKNIIKSITAFLKKIFGQDVSMEINNTKINEIKKNKNCNINVNNEGVMRNEYKNK